MALFRRVYARDIVINRLLIPAIRAEVESLTEEPRRELVEFAWGTSPWLADEYGSEWLGRACWDWLDQAVVLGVVECEATALRGGTPDDDLLARAAIATLDPPHPVLKLKDTVGAMEILEALMDLSCSPKVRADRADCVDAVLDQMDESDAIEVAAAIAMRGFPLPRFRFEWPEIDLSTRLAWAAA